MPKSIEAYWALMELALKEILLAQEDIEAPQFYACKIKDLDSYYGYLAWAEIYFKQKNQWGKAVSVLKELIKKEPKRPEAYIRLWQWHYEQMEAFEPAEEVIEQAYLRATDYEEVQYKILIYIMYAKTLFKRSKVSQAIEMLQQQYMEYPMYPIFLYHFGKMCAKHDSRYAGAAIGALDECLRSCGPEQHGVIAFWLFKAYIGARQHIEALMIARKAVRKLESKEHKKIKEINSFISIHNNLLVAHEAIETALENTLETEEQIEECKMLCSIIKNFDNLVGDMYLAKIYWESNQREKALKYLELLAENTNFMMKAHFLLIRYLLIMEEYARARIESQNLITKCKNPMVPTFVWMEAHLLYAKILTYNDSVAKAINILKCLAKVLPPFPNMDIGYIRVLQNSRNIEDLVKASINAQNFDEFQYEFQDFRTSIVDILQDEYIENISCVSILEKPRYTETKETLASLELVEQTPAIPELHFHKRSPTNFSSRLDNYKNAKKFKSLTIKTDFEQEETELIQTGRYRAAHEDAGVFDNSTSFSVYSDPLFLYKIGKYSGKYNIMPEDGLCAIKDFMRLLSYNINIPSDIYELLECKAKYWECIIKKNTNNLTDLEAVCELLGPKLAKLGKKKKFVRLYEILGKPGQLI
jgi:tetratricopeptide (TPR) repeat protein